MCSKLLIHWGDTHGSLLDAVAKALLACTGAHQLQSFNGDPWQLMAAVEATTLPFPTARLYQASDDEAIRYDDGTVADCGVWLAYVRPVCA